MMVDNDPTLEDLFSSLEVSTNIFNREIAAVNQLLSEAEKRLVAMNLGVEIWYDEPLEASPFQGGHGVWETSTRVVCELGFARLDGKWCFAVRRMKLVSSCYEGDSSTYTVAPYIESEPAPLSQQSRNLRAKAFSVLPSFLQEIWKEVEKRRSELAEARSKLRI